MAIERAHINGGLRLSPELDFDAQVEGIASAYGARFLPLAEEAHDLIYSDIYKHEVVVFGDGTGLYRLIPLFIKNDDEQIGGRQIVISKPHEIVYAPIYLEKLDHYRVYDLVRYVPGPNPEQPSSVHREG